MKFVILVLFFVGANNLENFSKMKNFTVDEWTSFFKEKCESRPAYNLRSACPAYDFNFKYRCFPWNKGDCGYQSITKNRYCTLLNCDVSQHLTNFNFQLFETH